MALNLTHLFTAIGRVGSNLFIINTAQAAQPTPYDELIAFTYITPSWLSNLSQSYDSLIRTESSSMGQWQQAAQTIVISLVLQQEPAIGNNLGACLNYVYTQMIAQSATVQACTITDTITADSGNVGAGSVFVTTIRGDGLILQNTIAETGILNITSDSFTGGQTAGQEPWQWAGQPNVSSLGTGTAVGIFDWDSPQGSGSSVSGRCIAANQYANSGANVLTNGDFATWVGSPLAPNNWNLVTGTWGTTIQRTTGMTASTFAVQFVAGATLNKLTTQFGNGNTLTGVTAGTSITLPNYNSFGANLYLKATGSISGGVMTVSLVDGSGTVINDQAGNANSRTITLSAISSSVWTQEQFNFRLPVMAPTTVRLQIAITTALAGANLNMAWVAFGQVQSSTSAGGILNLYAGGPNLGIFSRPDLPYEASPEPDGYTVQFTNDRGGSTYGATFQYLFNRLFQTPTLILPYTSGTPTLLDSLITTP